MLYLVVKLLLICVVVVKAEKQKCNMTETYVDECGKNLLVFGNRDIKIPKQVEELEKYCQNIDNGLKCFRRYSRTCLDAFSSQVISIIVKNGNKMADKVCKTPSGRNELFEHLQCFKNEEELSEVHLCMDKLIVQLEHMSNITGDNRIQSTCCSFHMLKECAEQKAFKICKNKEAVDYIKYLITEVTNELIKYACGKYRNLNDCDRYMDKNDWKMLKDIVASDDPQVIRSQRIHSSPFIALKNIMKQLREK